MGWNYKRMTDQDKKRRAAEIQAGDKYRKRFTGKSVLVGDDVLPAFVPKEGQNCVRLVPPIEVEDFDHWGMVLFFHRSVNFKKDDYLCLLEMGIGECPICEKQTPELWDSDPDTAKTLYPAKRVLALVIDLNEGSKTYGQLCRWSCPITLAEEIDLQSVDAETNQYMDMCDPVNGRLVFFKRTGKGLNTDYGMVQMGKKPYPLNDEIAAQRLPMIELLIVPTYDEVAEAISGGMASPPDSKPEPKTTEGDVDDKRFSSAKYERVAEPEPEAEAEEPEPELEPEPEAEKPEPDILEGMSREELKVFKVKHKKDIKALQFQIYQSTSDDELREKIRGAIISAGKPELIFPSLTEEAEEVPAKEEEEDPREREVNEKRNEIKEKLKEKLAQRLK